MEDQRPKKNELDKKFVIEEMYGAKGAYPSGTLVLAKVFITYTPVTQVPSSLESSASRSLSLEETLATSVYKILLVPLLLLLLFLLMRSLVTSGSSETNTRRMLKQNSFDDSNWRSNNSNRRAIK